MDNSFQNEQSTLGGLLHLSDLSSDAAQKVFSMLKVESFNSPKNKAVFDALLQLEKNGVSADLMTVSAMVDQNGHGSLVGGSVAYVADVMGVMPSAANIIAYADQVRQSAIKRTVNSKIQNALAEFNDLDGENIYQKLGMLESTIAALGSRSNNGRTNGLTHIKEIGREWSTALESRLNNPELHEGLSTGVESLDSLLGAKGLVKGSLVGVGARPKMGKTAFLMALASHVGIELNKPVGIFSLEMPNAQLYERIVSGESKINSEKFHSMDMTDGEWSNMSKSIGILNNANIFLDDTPSITLQHIKRESRKLARNKPVSMICVDYLTLMTAGKADRNDLAYGEITKGLKELAKELDCVVLLLTQLNRGLEGRPDKRPMPSDSRDTGGIEQDVDYWIGLYREGVYNDNLPPSEKGLTEAILRLNRHGETGTAYMDLRNGSLVSAQPFSFEKEQPVGKQF